MHISVACPRCQTVYQLEPSMRGKFMRCPNSVCRAVFEVREGDQQPAQPVEPPKKAETPSQTTGTVGDIVPILSAEAATPDKPRAASLPPANPPVAPSWETAPPARPKREQKIIAEEAPADSLSDLEEALSGAPTASATGETRTWEAPPIRTPRVDGFAVPQQTPSSGRSRSRLAEESLGGRTRRRMRRTIFVLLGLLIAGVSGGLYLSRGRQASHEAEYSAKAEKLYKDREFGDAAAVLQKLHREFPDSPEAKRYRFLAELSDVREAVYHPQEDAVETAKTHDRLRQFLAVYQNDPLVEKYKGDIEHSLLRVSLELVSLAKQKSDRPLLDRAVQALKDASRFRTITGPALDLEREIESKLPEVAKAIDTHEKRQNLMDALRRLANRPSSANIRTARSLAKDAGLQADSEIANLLQGMVSGHVGQVSYTSVFVPAQAPPFDDADTLGEFLAPCISSDIGRVGSAAAKDGDVVLGLSRGVLYALDARTGEFRWARRVGADSTNLPVRLPATTISPERYLIASTDQKTLTAVDAVHGKALWRQRLGDTPVGAPVLVGRHALMATASGRIDEVDTAEGTMLGFYTLGQSLNLGGVVQPGTGFVYVPADEFAIFIVDAVQHKCVGLLYSGHDRGSLRSPPFIIPDPDPTPTKDGPSPSTGWLAVTEVHNGDSRVRVFQLPVQTADDAPLPLDLKLKGWSWAGPYHDRERIALVTDAGNFALWGVRQKRNRDAAVFPIARMEFSAGKSEPGAAALVHAEANDFWISAGGKLHCLRLSMSPETGPAIAPVWRDPPEIGHLLHPAMSRKANDAKTMLYLACQSSHASNLIAVDAQTGARRWRCRLGLTFVGDPLVVNDALWLQDAQGVFALRRDSPGRQLSAAVSAGNDEKLRLLEDTRGKQGVVFVETGETQLKGQLIQTGGGAELSTTSFPLPAHCLGTPALAKDAVVLPLADGILLRLPRGEGLPSQGSQWRGIGVDDRQPGHVVAIGDADYVVTDGDAGLQVISWPEAKVWQKKAAKQLPRRIIAPPAVIPSPASIAVADSADTVTLLGAERLNVIREWPLGGKITQGPFVHGNSIGCVVSKNRLVWLDPQNAKPVWEYTFVAAVAGEPHLIDGFVVVADLAGNIVALDPGTGEAVGSGYAIAPGVSPAAAPVPFGKGRIFVPLTDGTFLDLPLTAITQ